MKNEGISRKQFISRAAAGLGLLAISGTGCLSSNSSTSDIKLRLLGPDHDFGHQLRKMKSLQPTQTITTQVLIVGGGIAGLACAWMLQKQGFEDYLLVELEAELGGNSRAGKMAGIEHPWGAHYLPLPDTSNKVLLDFLQETGVLIGYDPTGKPIYDELHLCHSPQERLQIHGKWQKGLVPNLGVPGSELSQIEAFSKVIEAFKQKIGSDGKPAFCIPAENSSNDSEIVDLDALSMKAWLLQQGWDSEHLHWYIDYCCRDDYGMEAADCSAWAGIHYFASRKGTAANAEENALLTWPEGNAWLARKLKVKMTKTQVKCGTMVASLNSHDNGVTALALEKDQLDQVLAINSEAAVFAGPQFVAARLIPERKAIANTFSYAPWMVANIQVQLKGNPLLNKIHWDNVCYGRKSLGYVHAAHQQIGQQYPDQTVLTWYEPLSQMKPKEGRELALKQDASYWRDYILEDMEYAHPGISKYISAIDIWPWGHAMIRPTPGLIKGKSLKEAQQPQGNIYFAHSDLSGISIFEEAFHRGITAAEAILKKFDLG